LRAGRARRTKTIAARSTNSAGLALEELHPPVVNPAFSGEPGAASEST
jgi:hypothetical protein